MKSSHEQFIKDMEEAGFEWEDYRGRNFYHGPAVRCDGDDLQKIIRKTSILLTWDQMGLGYIVHPF